MKTENKKTLRGSVLFTVVCVMALLIIFLTGTLALASASSNRAHKSYSSSQASYTARAAIDTFVQSMGREPGIPAAIENIGDTPLEVEMKINDPTLGVIGYYDDSHEWQKDKMVITPVADSAGYIFTDIDGDNNPEWVPVTAVKLTATCRVGKEEETVSAYIHKTASAHSEVTPGGLDGLQEVGGNAFPNGAVITGGLGLGISKDKSGLFTLHNAVTIETKSTFINGSVTGGTGSFAINIKNPVDNKTGKLQMPNSQTVIMGSLYMKNDSLFNLDYVMTNNFTQKDIPYIYIDESIAGLSSLNFVKSGKFVKKDGKYEFNGDANRVGKAPFNVFIGTFDSRTFQTDVKFGGADVYMLDEYTSDANKYNILFSSERDYASEELAAKDADRPGKENDRQVVVGDNHFGKDVGNTMLYDWASSYVHKSESQHKTTGGNLYSMGNLTLQQCTIEGDVRVNGNCTIKNGVTIKGDLIVKKTLTFDGGNANSVHGDIYCDNVVGGGAGNRDTERLKEGFIEHKNALLPRYKEVHNFIYENELVPDIDVQETIRSEKSEAEGWRYVITKPGDTTPTVLGWENDKTDGIRNADYCYKKIKDTWYVGNAYYETGIDGFVSDRVVTTPTVTYKGDPTTDEERVWIGDDGKPVYGKVDEDFSYYKMNEDNTVAEETDEAHAIATYYTKEGDPYTVYGRNEAYGSFSAVNHMDYTGSGKEPAYPDNMTRKAIYGYEDPDTHEFIEADPKTKIVKNIYEVREDLNMDENGSYDETVYHNHVPKRFCENAADDTFIDDPDDPAYNTPANKAQRNKLPYAFNNDGTPNTASGVWSDGKIIRSCIIGKTDGMVFKFENKKSYNVVGSGEGIWVVLQNVKTTDDSENSLLCDTTKGKVCFLIDKTLDISKTSIRPVVSGSGVQAYTENCIVTPDSVWGVEYYGTEGSSITMFNDCTLVGTFMCPETSFSGNVAGLIGCRYRGAYTAKGKETYYKSPIVGSAMFKHVDKALNDFGVLNSGGGGATKSKGSVKTALGTYEISYFTGS
ncbi:MAG: hypothetical protein K5898_16770 [Ruminococcus sp.]|uniref:hypothetical protein n=1 Tax=Ruminococcus sp. TaxID=41978 RepID=UPI0025D9EA8E|nr:hypothetical protein [Ruminococcus sp.]MCR4796791.1 hypothetical protein [Ruminococcus sp.]